jgi:hypothetical protein
MLYLLLDSSDSSLAVAAQVASWLLVGPRVGYSSSSIRYATLWPHCVCRVVCGHVEAPFGIVRLVQLTVRSFGRRPLRALAFSRDAGLNEDTTVEFVWRVVCGAPCAHSVEISESQGVLFLT